MSERWSEGLAAQEKDDVDVAPGGVGVRAHLMGAPDQVRGHLPVTDRREREVEGDGELVPPVADGEQAHRRVDRDVTGLEPAAAGDAAEGTFEARGVADREQFLRV